MSKNNITIQYHDFHPSEASKDFISSVIEEIQHELPSGAKVKATFSAKDNVVKGMLNVGSYAGPFFAVAAASNVREVTLALLSQMRRRIEKFKTKSNERRSIRHMDALAT